MNEIQVGQLWEYTDRRTGWQYTVLVTEQRLWNDTTLTANWNAHVLYWDTDYEFNGPYQMVLAEWELRQWYKRIE